MAPRKIERKTEKTCYYCKHLCAYGYHDWGCRLIDERIDRNGSCPNWEDYD